MSAKHFVINFPVGGSGRFLAHIIWCMINNLDRPILQNEVNSAHETHIYSKSWDLVDRLKENSNLQRPMAYSLFRFKQYRGEQNTGVLTIHSFPDWNTIRLNENFKHAKFLLINIQQQDIIEILINGKIKNDLHEWQSGRNQREHFYQEYIKLFGPVERKDLGTSITLDHLKVMIKNQYRYLYNYVIPDKMTTDMGHLFEYIDISYDLIPEDFKEKTLIVNYSDMVDYDTFGKKTLDQIALFTDTRPSDFIKQQWNNYIANRKIFLNKHDYSSIEKFLTSDKPAT